MQEIAAASREQAGGIGQLSAAMTQLDRVSQHTASSSEELAATAEELSGQAAALQQTVAFFKLASLRLGADEPAAPQPAYLPPARPSV